MADAVFRFRRHLRERKASFLGEEHRIVAEPTLARRFPRDSSIHPALDRHEDRARRHAVPNHLAPRSRRHEVSAEHKRQTALEAGGTFGRRTVAQFRDQFAPIVFVGRIFAGIPRAVDTWGTAEGIHTQPSVVRQGWKARGQIPGGRLEQRVVLQRSPSLIDFGQGNVCSADQLQLRQGAFQQRRELLKLVLVTRRYDEIFESAHGVLIVRLRLLHESRSRLRLTSATGMFLMATKTSQALERFSVDEGMITKTLGALMNRRIDDGDIYFEHVVSESLSLEEGMVKQTSRSVHQGVGVRAVSGDKTGYAHSDEVDGQRLLESAKTARAIADQSAAGGTVALRNQSPAHNLYPISSTPTVEQPLDAKLELLGEIDRLARAYDPRIQEVMAGIASNVKTVVIVDKDGRITLDERPLQRISVTCIAAEGTNRQVGRSGGGGRATFDVFLEGDMWKEYVEEAARRAILNLSAVDTPAGAMDVVLGPGWPGILLHEAIGHGLEGDFNRKATSAFSGLLGQSVASPLVTVVDDGTIGGRRGSLNVDDEGTPTQRNVLIENGILKGYMQDRMNARLMGVAPTGNGRRQSYSHVPMPRMTNTFMLAGKDDPEEIIKGVKRGIYAVAFGGGQVDITSGKFTFTGSEAYLIEDGKVTRPIKGATFIGSGPDVLKRVTAVGHDLALDRGVGVCGKDGQSVPVGVGLPTIRINGLTVGGVATQ